jgi:hypothetical protein
MPAEGNTTSSAGKEAICIDKQKYNSMWTLTPEILALGNVEGLSP